MCSGIWFCFWHFLLLHSMQPQIWKSVKREEVYWTRSWPPFPGRHSLDPQESNLLVCVLIFCKDFACTQCVWNDILNIQIGICILLGPGMLKHTIRKFEFEFCVQFWGWGLAVGMFTDSDRCLHVGGARLMGQRIHLLKLKSKTFHKEFQKFQKK